MPFCPYGISALKEILSMQDDASFLKKTSLYYIAQEYSDQNKVPTQPSQASSVSVVKSGCEQTITTQPDFGRFSTLHGRQETEESMRQVVIQKRWPRLFLTYLKAFLDDPNGSWQHHAELAGIPTSELNDLVHSPTGAKWFSENIRQARDKGITLSPTLVINGEPLPRFPQSQEDLRVTLCSAGVLKENCHGVLCDSEQSCPDRLGYTGTCERGRCVYELSALRPDAVPAWIIVPEDCIPTEKFPIANAIGGWASYLKLMRIGLTEAKAQELLDRVKVTSFPVLVIEETISEREWGKQCIQELNLLRHENRFLVTFDYTASPFVTYAQIVRDQTGLHVKPNHYSGALLLHQIGEIEAAAKSYRLALAENPEDYRAWNNLGAILYDHHDLKQAGGKMFQRAAGLNVSYEPALRNLLRFAEEQRDIREIAAAKERLGWLAIEKKHWKDGLNLLTDASRTKEWEFSARKGLAFIAVQESRPADALAELERCLKLNPEPDGNFANLLAGVYFRLGDHSKAAVWYEKAVDDSHSSERAYPNLCHLFHSTEHWEKLLSVSDKAFSLYPNNPGFGFYKAEALARLNRTSEAISLLKELSRTSESSAFRSCYELAMLYRLQEEKLDAAAYAGQFIQAVRIQRQPAVRNECMNIGNMALEFGDHDLAAQAFQQVLRMKPSDVTAHKLLAVCYKQLGQPDRSQEHLILARQFGGDIE